MNIKFDANFINYAGRLRIMNYKMAHLSHEILLKEDNEALKKELLATMAEYERTLIIIYKGYPIEKLKKLNHKPSLEKIIEFNNIWHGSHKDLYFAIINDNSRDSLNKINSTISDHVNEIDKMVSDYSSHAENKVKNAIIRNGLTIILIILVAVYSFISVKNKIRKPMEKLLRELDAMDLIDDQLASKINLSQKDELATMSSYIDELLYDGLTRTYNRRVGLSRLSALIEGESKDLHFSLIFIDINGLKEVNDILGHDAGDQLINNAVDNIKETIREEDFIVRLGGDEFLVALIDVNREKAEEIWSRILMKYDKINRNSDNPFIISASHGIVEYKKGDQYTLEDLVKIADKKMYEEKKRIKEDPNYKIIKDKSGVFNI